MNKVKLSIGQPKTLLVNGLPAGSSIHPMWSVISGTVQLQPSADGKSCVVSDDSVGESIISAKVANTAVIVYIDTVEYDLEIIEA